MWWILGWSVATVLLIAGCCSSARTRRGAMTASAGVVSLSGLAATFGYIVGHPGSPLALLADDRLLSQVPKLGGVPEYVSSGACISCHPDNHASWHKTYHRTMTQLADTQAVVGKFDGSEITYEGLTYRVFMQDGEYWAEMPDPDEMMFVFMGNKPLKPVDIPRVKRRVVMTTGSHHYQTYWVESPRFGRLMQTLPLVWLIKDQRWIPREQAFMHPPGRHMVTQWNHHCIRCHSTGGVPGLDETTGRLDTRVGEMGISCEACHGPAEAHIRAHRQAQLSTDGTWGADFRDPIVNPADLDHRASSQVCGQCHGVYTNLPEKAMKFAKKGSAYRPGDDLHKTRYYIQHPEAVHTPEFAADFKRNPDFYPERWWEDGTILAGGREYTAISASACFTKGEMSCLSCHSMHNAPPNDQVKRGMDTSAACTQCHFEPEYTTEISRHTFHSAGSSGSDCLNCHMPHTTYALFGAIRNHQIRSPSVGATAKWGVPNACNLCHLDKSLGWTRDALARWHGHPNVPLSPEQEQISAAVLAILKGHAAQRAVTAWHFGWRPARETSGDEWMAPVLAQLLTDPYPVVRYVASSQLREVEEFRDFTYDFLASGSALIESRERALRTWTAARRAPSAHAGRFVLMKPNGEPDMESIHSLLKQRDNRPVSIKE